MASDMPITDAERGELFVELSGDCPLFVNDDRGNLLSDNSVGTIEVKLTQVGGGFRVETRRQDGSRSTIVNVGSVTLSLAWPMLEGISKDVVIDTDSPVQPIGEELDEVCVFKFPNVTHLITVHNMRRDSYIN